jgi:hypothetical protein
MIDNFQHEFWAIRLFNSYSIKRHIELLYFKVKLVETGQISIEQLSINKFNPYFEEHLN